MENAGKAALEQLIRTPPLLHSGRDQRPWEPGDLVDWGIHRESIEFLARVVTAEHLTLETGAGLSTVCFAIRASEHICISPPESEHQRIRDYCQTHNISTARIRFVPMPSGDYLPTLDLKERQLDLALIDGAHKFPYPIVDWFFIDPHLKIGGLLVIDDLSIPSVKMLWNFLRTEPAYQFEQIVGTGMGVFRKVARVPLPFEADWDGQRLNRAYPDFSHLPWRQRVRRKIERIPVLVKLYRAVTGRARSQ